MHFAIHSPLSCSSGQVASSFRAMHLLSPTVTKSFAVSPASGVVAGGFIVLSILSHSLDYHIHYRVGRTL